MYGDDVRMKNYKNLTPLQLKILILEAMEFYNCGSSDSIFELLNCLEGLE